MSPAQFSAKLRKFAGKLAPELASKLQRKLVLEALTRCVNRSPVDTGRFRANWTVSVGQEGLRFFFDATDAGRSSGVAVNRERPIIDKIPAFSIAFVQNNIPYAEVIEFGGYVPKDPPNSPDANKHRASSRSKPKREAVAAKFGDPGYPLVRGGFSIQAPRGIASIVSQELAQIFAPEADTAARDVFRPEVTG